MNNNPNISKLINAMFNDHIENIQDEIASSKIELENIAQSLREIEITSEEQILNQDSFEEIILQQKELIIQNFNLIKKIDELAKLQEDMCQFVDTAASNHFVEEKEVTLTPNEELYVMREIRNFYIENDDFENTYSIAKRIKKYRDSLNDRQN